MMIDNFFTTRVLANLFGMKGFERDLFFAMSYTNLFRNANRNKKDLERTRFYNSRKVIKTTGTSKYDIERRAINMPIASCDSTKEINKLINKTDSNSITDKQLICSASVADFKAVLAEVARKKLEQKKSSKVI